MKMASGSIKVCTRTTVFLARSLFTDWRTWPSMLFKEFRAALSHEETHLCSFFLYPILCHFKFRRIPPYVVNSDVVVILLPY